ncbi:MAG TPA: SH3 domain-containing protein [Bryobacteraceae bacterium]|nr:SH3 domain-containing protein [Bryobacteraceae bacterium]
MINFEQVSPRFPKSWVLLAAILFSGCASKPEPAPSIGVAYAGPAALSLHADVETKSPVVATVHHGEKLEIIARRRRLWYKVRTTAGVEGWALDRDLLDTAQMQRLEKLAAEAANLPSQGVASTFAPVNVHAEPNRLAASFIQLQAKEEFDILAHRVAPRTAPPRRELIPPAPKKEAKKKAGKEEMRKEENGSVVPPPPAPPAPAPPPDWLELSKSGEQAPEAPAGKPAPNDDWTLIRTKNGQTGWVLTNAIYLEIPDEVAQYAEGHRITSYFSIGKTRDGGVEKDIWMWTTSETLGEDHDFDSYRVFTWSLRHHRYETAYIQRRERGYFPVLAKQGEFSVCLEKKDGTRGRKLYTLNGNSVRPAGETPCAEAPKVDEGPIAQALPEAPEQASEPGLMDRFRAMVNRWRGKKK